MRRENSIITETIGLNIARGRKRLGLNQAELGELIGSELGTKVWFRSTVSQAEKGSRALIAAEVVALCNILGIGLAELFDGVPVAVETGKLRPVLPDAARSELVAVRDRLDAILIEAS